MKTQGEADDDPFNGLTVDVTMSDGHILRIFSDASPVSLNLGHRDDIRLGPEPEEDDAQELEEVTETAEAAPESEETP